MKLTYSQCKQIAANGDLRDTIEALNNAPEWLDIDDLGTVQAVQQGGCASGAYMPAVTYWQAAATMAEHGDDVLDYIQENYGELLTPPSNISWSGLAVFYLSMAVELWCGQFDLDGVDWD